MIECECGLCNESIPKVHGKVAVGAAQSGDEVVFPSSDCAFGGVASVHVWGYQLVFNIVGLVVLF